MRLWLNYAHFLSVSVAYPTDLNPAQMAAYGEAAAERVWPQTLEDFWANLLKIAWTPGIPPDMRAALLNFFEQIPPTSIEPGVRVIKELRDAPPQEVVDRRRRWGKKKRPGQDEKADELQAVGWIFHEEVLDLISRFVSRLTKQRDADGKMGAGGGGASPPTGAPAGEPERSPQGALPRSLAQTLQFCVSAWVADFERLGAESCRNLSLGTRNAGTRMVRVYLTPSAGVMAGGANVPPAIKLVQWLLAWTPPPPRVYVEAAYR